MIINDEHTSERAGKNTPVFVFLVIFFLFSGISLIYMYITNSFLFSHEACGHFTQCQSNLKNMGTALELYAVDNGGRFPYSLDMLVPEYIDKVPKCAAAGKDTYSKSYQAYNSYKFTFTMDGEKYYDYTMETDAYTVFCSGHYHTEAGAGQNYPHYNSRAGLVPK